MSANGSANPSTPSLTVHHLEDSRSIRIIWLLEELEVPYQIKKYQRVEDRMSPEALKKINPKAGSPVITDGDLTLPESGAIVEYIRSKYDTTGKIAPPESGKIDDLYYLHYVEGSLMPLLVDKLIFQMLPEKAPFFVRPILRAASGTVNGKLLDPRLKIHARLIEEHLAKSGDFFAGGDHPTAADFMIIFALEIWGHRHPELLGDKAKAYVKKIHSRPAFKRAVEKAGGHMYA
ncbi:hypothetical protein CERSUDRAFT_140479 [Gelatoporia subvermispora B]|uniref:GST N-terminal domain-containing protein n=1 Tax=Ceriporiopsis subvermispora (strain B) TaxID=914234 RepID=M2QCR2_CERS8|nr:hypothetical protein CERSUDRAFT_140479 [Gelatoporia subvermispora B]